MRSWNQNFRRYKGRVVLRGDIVRDDSGAYAVFTAQGSSASQMTAAKVMDGIARPPDCDGRAADAVSASTQVKLEDAPKLLKIPKGRKVQTYGYVYHDRSGPNLGTPLNTEWFLLKETCTDIQLLGLQWERQVEEVLLELGVESPELGMSICSQKTRIILIGIRG